MSTIIYFYEDDIIHTHNVKSIPPLVPGNIIDLWERNYIIKRVIYMPIHHQFRVNVERE